MSRLNRLFFVLVVLLLFSTMATARSRQPQESLDALLDGHKIVNIVDDFLIFWEQAKGRTLPVQRRLFARLVEAKYPVYFERAVYRNAPEEERRALLNQFLAQIPAHIGALKQFNRTVEDEIRLNIANFKYRFPEYRQQRDIYIGLSFFMFDGSVRAVQNEVGIPDTLCLSAEVLCDYPLEELQIAITHELFHLYHFGFLFANVSFAQLRTGHLPLIVEGLAIAGTEAVYPHQSLALYLHFTETELAAQRDDLAVNARRFLELLKHGAKAEKYGEWFTDAPGDEAPKRGGYLLGYEVAQRLLGGYRFAQIVRMSPERLHEHIEEHLKAIASERILLLCSPNF